MTLAEVHSNDRLARQEGADAWEAVFEAASPDEDVWEVARRAAKACNEARHNRGWKSTQDVKDEVREYNAKYGVKTDEDWAKQIKEEAGVQ